MSSLELRCFFFPCELNLILQHLGFMLEAKHRDFDNSPLSGRSPKQICIYGRARAEGGRSNALAHLRRSIAPGLRSG